MSKQMDEKRHMLEVGREAAMRFKVGSETTLVDAFETELFKHMHDAEEVSRRMGNFMAP